MTARVRDRLLLSLYPKGWRARYGDEFLALLSERTIGARDALDVVRGAADARLHRLGRPRRPLDVIAAVPPSVPVRAPAAFGIVAESPSSGIMSRRHFMRRMLGAGVGLLSLEFVAGTFSFLWPNIREGLGGEFRIGRLVDILDAQPSFAEGRPYAYNPARLFLINVPAAMAWAQGQSLSVPNPSADELLALWRKCPHLGCLVPMPCESIPDSNAGAIRARTTSSARR